MVIGNKAAIFHAPDEGGKTTLVSQYDKNKILSDDQVCIKKNNGKIKAYSTPFGQIGNSTLSADVKGIFHLEKSDKFEISSMDKNELIKFLWMEHKFVWFCLPLDLRTAAFNLIVDYCTRHPVYKLKFPKNYVDWDAVESALK